MNIKLIINLAGKVIPQIIGLTGYKDRSKTGTLSALKDGSKFTTFVVIITVGILMLLPTELRETIVTSVYSLGVVVEAE